MPQPATAATPWTLPDDSVSVYGGAGVGTFDIGMSSGRRDRQLQVYANGWAGWGWTDTTQVDTSVVLSHHRVVDDPAEGPCPSPGDYCSTSTGLGLIKLGLTHRFAGGSLPLSARIGVAADPWNRGQRDRWTNIGQGTVGIELDGITELGKDLGKARVSAALSVGGHAALPRKATSPITNETRWVVAPTARASLESAVRQGPLRVALTVYAQQRLWGLPYGAEWVTNWRSSVDLWGVARWGEVRPELKVSIEPVSGTGIHLAASRPVWVQAGPPNLWNVSIGVHHYWPPPTPN